MTGQRRHHGALPVDRLGRTRGAASTPTLFRRPGCGAQTFDERCAGTLGRRDRVGQQRAREVVAAVRDGRRHLRLARAVELGRSPGARALPSAGALEADFETPASASLSRWKATTERGRPSVAAAASLSSTRPSRPAAGTGPAARAGRGRQGRRCGGRVRAGGPCPHSKRDTS